jgi:transcriptional regulator with XRE-family HTH domain
MSQSALKPKLAKLGLRQSDLARLIDVSPRTVNLWATGAQSLPGAVDGYLRLLEAAAPNVRKAELDRLDDHSKHLDEGIYGIFYSSPAAGEHGYGMAVLLRGKIAGGDAHGVQFSGSYRFDRIKAVNVVQLSLGVGPNGDGLAETGGALQATFTVTRAQPIAAATAMFGPEAYQLELRYLGPLPE